LKHQWHSLAFNIFQCLILLVPIGTDLYRSIKKWSNQSHEAQQAVTAKSTMASSRASAASSPAWANPNGRPLQPPIEISDDLATNELMQPFSTLDEPVLDTIMRDVRAVGSKLRIVMLPLDRNMHFGYSTVEENEGDVTEELGENQKKVIESLKDWDLW
jgi:hypothetical protein